MISVLAHHVKAMDMGIPYQHAGKVAINQHLKPPTSTRLDTTPVAVFLLPALRKRVPWPAIPYGQLLQKRWTRRSRSSNAPGIVCTELPNDSGTRIVLGRVQSDASTFELLSQARDLAKQALTFDPLRVLIHCVGLETEPGRRALEALIAALLAAVCPMPSWKRESPDTYALRRIECYGLNAKIDVDLIRAETQGNHLARWLTQLPPNELTPAHYRSLIEQLAKRHGWTLKVLDQKALQGKKAGAFLAVVQGSAARDAAILHLAYRPNSHRRPAVALVGKGICFDTGGINLKSARSMHGMHEDMEGSAVALGTLLSLTLLDVDFGIDCWLAVAENHIGPMAYKPNDVVTAANGTTIEIIHSDAEGRMVLADTLAFAGKAHPDLIVDYATLTGACVNAVSTRYSGAFCNREALLPSVIEAGRDSGERVWPFPMDGDFDKALESKIADIKQCSLDNEADHILAARFLSRFVPDNTAWLHIDLASGNHKSGLAHIPTDVTGFGVRFTLNLLLKQDVLSKAPL